MLCNRSERQMGIKKRQIIWRFFDLCGWFNQTILCIVDEAVLASVADKLETLAEV